MNNRNIQEIPYKGTTLRFWIADAQEYIQSYLARGELYEQDLIDDSFAYIDSSKWIVDVGANVGNHVIAWGCTTEASILAIEPNPRCLAIMRENIELNTIGNRVEVAGVAAGRTPQHGSLVQSDQTNLGRIQVVPCQDGTASSSDVVIKPLDQIVGDRKVSILKIDVEGMEHDVLDGARRVLTESQPILYVEISDGLDQIYRLLNAYGYRLSDRFALTPTFLFVHRSVDDAINQSSSQIAAQTWKSGRNVERRLSNIDRRLRELSDLKRNAEGIPNGSLRHLVNISRASIEELSDPVETSFSSIDPIDKSFDWLSRNIELVHNQTELQFERSNAMLEQTNALIQENLHDFEARLMEFQSKLERSWIIVPSNYSRKSSDLTKKLISLSKKAKNHAKNSIKKHTGRGELIINPNFKDKTRGWRLNQRVSADSRGDNLFLVKNQSHSTPGIFQRIRVRRNRYYKLEVFGSSESQVTLWVADANKRRITPQNVQLSRKHGSVSTLLFNPGKLQRLCVGVLFGSSAPTGSRAVLQGISLRQVSEPNRYRSKVAVELKTHKKLRAPGDSICKVVINYVNYKKPIVSLLGVNYLGKTVFARNLPKGNNQTSVLFFNRKSQKLRVFLKSDGACDVELFDVTLERLSGIFHPPRVEFVSTTRSASMATYPLRSNLFPTAVDSMIDQVDYLFIYLNNYDSVPEYLLRHPKKHKLHWILDKASGFRASAKLYWADKIKGYQFVVDDDIIYPPDYTKRMIDRIEYYRRDAVLGVHGVVYDTFVDHPKRDRRHVYNFQNSLPNDEAVNLVGTGTAAWHSDTMAGVDLSPILKHPIAIDEGFAVILKTRGISAVSPSREDQWLRSNPLMSFGIYEEKQLNDSAHNRISELLRANAPWPEPKLPEVG